ncbi:hypothetical protein M2347_001406 [Chryseobacterium sp. H1D6B]|uniref:hypothetical protein n=1 Tax=Chryseobacterium sp. H1D6B TaxID=2940588 RepID=UPI0015CA4E39|nr:hypothetical protein [Chryseobacterium sp. H1D6B]MDH6251679.1 hypothetical protein [Chryseobacterium sp. H1D6B]
MKQYDEREFTLITHGDMETYQWLIKENIKRNRRNSIVFNIVIYTFISVIAITAIFMVTKDIFFENYHFSLFDQEERIKIQDQKINKINQQIKMEDDYGSLETPSINNKVHEIESRLDDLEDN